MNKSVGLWLDNHKAVVVSISDSGESRRFFTSNMDHYLRFSKGTPSDGSPEDPRDRRYWTHIGEYFNLIVDHIRGAHAIQIFGPGEAKFELERRLGFAGMAQFIVSVDETDALTDARIIARVRDRFPARAQYNVS
jgi:hypothetical protein